MSTPHIPGRQEFDVELFAESGGTGIAMPFSALEVFGKRGQVKVRGTIDGVPYRGSIAPMGGGTHVMVVKKEIREAIGKGAGDHVHVIMELDTEERIVVVPDDLQE